MRFPLALWLAPAIAAAGAARVAPAQAPVSVTVRVTAEGAPIERATVRAGAIAALTTAAGTARLSLARGSHELTVTRLGYRPDTLRLELSAGDTTVFVELEAAPTALEGIIISSARGARRIEEEPTRVEVLSGDDVAEKTEMRPADVTRFLAEMPGVRLQQTSAATGAAAIRIQGLRPRYTLLLADGLPLYGGTGGAGLDLLQLPPADLRQIEVIKGPASALYGASALGGTINLVSRRPAHEGDLLVQGTDQQGANAFAWISRRLDEHVGYTTVAGLHRQARRDMDGDGWFDLPGFSRVEVRPRLFLDGAHGASLFLTGGATIENRDGGSSRALDTSGLPYREAVDTRRGDVGVVAHRLLGSEWLTQVRGAANVDDKHRVFGAEDEDVRRTTAFAEASVSGHVGSHDLLGGIALQRDAATIDQATTLDYAFVTSSAFAQDAWQLVQRVALSASVRGDHHSRYGTAISPRASLLISPSATWGIRLSGSRGFYAPTPFVEETDPVGVRHVRGFADLRREDATYGSIDLTGTSGPFELNATVFASSVQHAVLASTPGSSAGDGILLENATAQGTSRGVELFTVYDLEPLFITALYAHTVAREPLAAAERASSPDSVRRDAPYMPRNSGGIDVTWEAEETGTWIAVEAFYTGAQRLSDDPYRSKGPPYTTVGVLVSQRFGPFKVFLNAENLSNVHQTKYAPLVLPARDPAGRWTVSPWAPIEGRVLSVGVRRAFGRAG